MTGRQTTPATTTTPCGGEWQVWMDCDHWVAECRRCRKSYDIGHAWKRYDGQRHGMPPPARDTIPEAAS